MENINSFEVQNIKIYSRVKYIYIKLLKRCIICIMNALLIYIDLNVLNFYLNCIRGNATRSKGEEFLLIRLFNRALKRSSTIFSLIHAILLSVENSRQLGSILIYLLRGVDVHDSFIVTFSVDWSADGSCRSLAVAPFRNLDFILFTSSIA